jgi:peroxiredoxin
VSGDAAPGTVRRPGDGTSAPPASPEKGGPRVSGDAAPGTVRQPGDGTSAPPAANRDPSRSQAPERGVLRTLRATSKGLMGLLACGAIGLIAMLLLALGAVQVGPGGILSDVRVGTQAPDFELAMLDGHNMKLSDHRGRPVALTFWTTWCQGCVFELPALQQAMVDHADQGLVVLAVNAGEWPADVESWLEARDIDVPVPLDAQKAVYKRYGVVGLPTTVWLDATGTIRAVHVGTMSADDIAGYVAKVAPTPDGS